MIQDKQKDSEMLQKDSLIDSKQGVETNLTDTSDQNNLTIESLNIKIIEITTFIKAKFPELSPFLDGDSFTESKTRYPESSFQHLSEYYLSLEEIINKYQNEKSDEPFQ